MGRKLALLSETSYPERAAMLRNTILITTLTLSMLMPWSTQALTIAEVDIPEHITLAEHSLTLNGAGLRRKAIFNVYVAALYTPTPTHDAQVLIHTSSPQQMRLYLRRDLSANDLIEALRDGMHKNLSPQEQEELAPAQDLFQRTMEQVGAAKKGDIVTLNLFGPKVEILFNQNSLAEINDAKLGAALLKIWLGEHPAQASLKEALLGGQ